MATIIDTGGAGSFLDEFLAVAHNNDGSLKYTKGPVYDVRAFGAVEGGVQDAVAAFQAAHDALPAIGGGIYFPGRYLFNGAGLAIRKDNVALVGDAPGPRGGGTPVVGGSTILVGPSFSGAKIIDVADATDSRTLAAIRLANFTIDGQNNGTLVDGIGFRVNRSLIDNVVTTRMTGYGIRPGAPVSWTCWDSWIRSCHAEYCALDGIFLDARAADMHILSCITNNNTGSGLKTVAAGALVVGLHSYGNTVRGININGAPFSIISGSRIENNNGGVYVDGTSDSYLQIVGTRFRNNSVAADNTTDNINLNPSSTTNQILVDGCLFVEENANKARYHINVASSNCQDTEIGNNSFGACSTAHVNDVGTRTRRRSVLLAQSAAGVSHTGDANEFAFATITVPGRTMGVNGRLRIETIWSYTNSANNKTLRVRFSGISGTVFFTQTATTTVADRQLTDIANRGATNSQVGGPPTGVGGVSTAGSANTTSAVDTTADTTIVITGQLATTTETITLESYTVELLPG